MSLSKIREECLSQYGYGENKIYIDQFLRCLYFVFSDRSLLYFIYHICIGAQIVLYSCCVCHDGSAFQMFCSGLRIHMCYFDCHCSLLHPRFYYTTYADLRYRFTFFLYIICEFALLVFGLYEYMCFCRCLLLHSFDLCVVPLSTFYIGTNS